jgi:hypothetical protein
MDKEAACACVTGVQAPDEVRQKSMLFRQNRIELRDLREGTVVLTDLPRRIKE